MPKQVIMIATPIQVATVYVLHCVRAIRYQAKSDENLRQDLIPRAPRRGCSHAPLLVVGGGGGGDGGGGSGGGGGKEK